MRCPPPDQDFAAVYVVLALLVGVIAGRFLPRDGPPIL
jgi:uncharacterized protein YneF (UPF0154 family)